MNSNAALARAHCEKRRTYHVHVPTHPALCLGTSVPRQKIQHKHQSGFYPLGGGGGGGGGIQLVDKGMFACCY